MSRFSHGYSRTREIAQWTGPYIVAIGLIFLGYYVEEVAPYIWVVICFICFHLGRLIGFRTGAGYWEGESPEEQTLERIDKLGEEYERSVSGERAYRFGQKLGKSLRRK